MSSNSSPNSCFFFLFSSSCALDCECVLPNTLYGNSTVCNETTGQCTCKPRIGGRQCDRCHENAYNTSRGCVGKCGRGYIQIPPCLRNSCQCIQRVCDVLLHLRRLTCMRRMHGSREQMMIMILISKKKLHEHSEDCQVTICPVFPKCTLLNLFWSKTICSPKGLFENILAICSLNK